MSDPRSIKIEDYTYDLPDDRIATFPKEQRDQSKLLVYKKGEIQESVYANVGDFLPENTHLVFNNTRVIQARLHFDLPSGRTIEIFCLEPEIDQMDISIAMNQTGEAQWWCLVGGAKKWKDGVELEATLDGENPITIKVNMLKRGMDSFLIQFKWDDDSVIFADLLEKLGNTPLPPYIKRSAEQTDKSRYQTVFAEHNGSVAAPTAGLHFTSNLIQKLNDQGVQQHYVTLHVGAGTFKPVSADTIDDHIMHHELIEIDREALVSLSQVKERIIPVGTTSMRTLESLYWLGVKALEKANVSLEEFYVSQWDPYGHTVLPSKQEAISALVDFLDKHQLDKLITKTQLIIIPGYKFKMCDGLITNFHQPKSTLLLLVSALIGSDWRRVYKYAMDNDFRFLSYGDGSLLLR